MFNGSHKTEIDSLSFGVWLVPEKTCKNFLNSLMTQLAIDYQSVSFEPHLTLFSGTTNDEKKLINNFQKITENQHSLTLIVKEIDATIEYYKSVFISFDKNKKLTALHNKLKSLDPSSQYQLNPHLSLLYQNMRLEKKREIAKKITLSFKEVVFDQLVLILFVDKKSADAVKSWKYLCRKILNKIE